MRSIIVSGSPEGGAAKALLFGGLFLLLLSQGCTPRTCRDNSDPPEVEIGQGLMEYQPMGDSIELFHGQQGGYHLDLALMLRNLNGEDLISGTLTATVGGQQVGETSPWFDTTCTADGLEVTGTRVVFDDGVGPEALVGESVVVGAVVRDLQGNEATGEVTTTIVDTVDENPEE